MQIESIIDQNAVVKSEMIQEISPIFGALPVNAQVPFISHDAKRLENDPLPQQMLTLYDVFMAAFVMGVSEDHTRLERIYQSPLDSNKSDGIITFADDDFVKLPASLQTLSHIGSIEADYVPGSHSPEIKIPFLNIRLGDPTLNDVANAIVSLRVRGFLASDVPSDRDSIVGVTPTFDTGELSFLPDLANFKVRLYPYHLAGAEAIYTPLQLISGIKTGIHPNYLRITVSGVRGLVSISIPALHGATLKSLSDGIEKSLMV